MYNLDVYSHYVKVTGFDKRGIPTLLEFCKTLAQYGLVRVGYGRNSRMVRKMMRVFAASTQDRSEFRFHVHQLEELKLHLEQTGQTVNVKYHACPKGKDVKLEFAKWFVPREYQVGIIDYLSNESRVNVLTLQTGRGKTLTALKAIHDMQKRALLVVKGQYVEQWIENYNESLVGPKKDLMVVRGARQLRALIDLAMNGNLDAKFIIITSTTMYNYIKDYELHSGHSPHYPIPPDRLCEICEIDTRLVDEAHNMFHLNFKLDLYTHVRKTINLSATLKSSDEFKDKMYRLAYPPHMRYQGAEYLKYIAAQALFYSLKDADKVRWKAKGRGSYSHMEFEKSLMKDQALLDNYFEMLSFILKTYYLDKRKPGMKFMFFMATKKMCTLLTERLSAEYEEVDTRRYIDEDPRSNVMEAEVIVSTLQSAGTAIDIPGLYATCMTTALGSRELNEQALGRTRELKDYPDETPWFLYLVCDNIDKHHEYHEMKKEFFADKVLSHKEATLPFHV